MKDRTITGWFWNFRPTLIGWGYFQESFIIHTANLNTYTAKTFNVIILFFHFRYIEVMSNKYTAKESKGV